MEVQKMAKAKQTVIIVGSVFAISELLLSVPKKLRKVEGWGASIFPSKY